MSNHGDVCERAAREGGRILLDWIGRFSVREKGPSDLVTDADHASQEAIRIVIGGAYPDHAFVGEEDLDGIRRHDGGYRWIVDPLDGTTNYVHQIPHYAVSIGLECDGRLLVGTVYDPVANDCYRAESGRGATLNGKPLRVSSTRSLSEAVVAASFPAGVQRGSQDLADFENVLVSCQAIRRTGSAALNLCYVAAGRFDAYWARETKAWDVAAGALLVMEAGGHITGLAGQPFNLADPRFIAAATPELHADLSSRLSPA